MLCMKKYFSIIVTVLLAVGCSRPIENVDFRQEMRDFVVEISRTARQQNPDFMVIPQNGLELIATGQEADGTLATDYLDAIDGHGQEELFYGYKRDNVATPEDVTNYWLEYLHRSQLYGKTILSIDYCTSADHVADAQQRNDAEHFVSFVAPHRELDVIPDGPISHENNQDILKLSDAQNFLYLINPQNFSTKQAFIQAVCATNYDLLVMDLFLDEDAFTAEEVEQLHHKANGGRRLVICYLSIGEAENYRYYWDPSWRTHKPEWLERANPRWPGNYKVRYWHPDWQNIICGPGDSYLNRILTAHFDGVYLDLVDAFQYFEN